MLSPMTLSPQRGLSVLRLDHVFSRLPPVLKRHLTNEHGVQAVLLAVLGDALPVAFGLIGGVGTSELHGVAVRPKRLDAFAPGRLARVGPALLLHIRLKLFDLLELLR